MSISSILSSGMQSLQASMNRTAAAGSRIAGFGAAADNSDLAASMVALRQGAIDAKIAANVIKTGDEMLGTMINLRT
ncbi:MAG: hypothetical protein ACM3X0_04665 [Bacteroidota bacterium]